MDTTARKRNEIRLAVRNEQLRYQFQMTQSIADNAAEALILMDGEHRVVFVNPAAARMLGQREERIVGRALCDLVQFQREGESRPGATWSFFQELASINEPKKCRATIVTKNGARTPVHCSLSPVMEGREIGGSVLVMSDISEQIEAEQALRESLERQRQLQKLEAIGRLAGGIAHDFNNLLQAILGFVDLSTSLVDQAHPIRGYLAEIQKAGEKAATLTAQLLAYGRKQRLVTQVERLDDLVRGIEPLIRDIGGANVRVDVGLAGGDSCVDVDRHQLEQAILNLAMNANEAMPGGGVLSIRTGRKALGPQDFEALPEGLGREGDVGLVEGDYGVIEVGDTGYGMSESVRERVFEPFFTTKEIGRGSGLGLPTAYGIVRQLGGSIQVFRGVGRGSTFRILLPLIRGAEEAATSARSVPSRLPSKVSETILLVEDEVTIRELFAELLVSKGYDVLRASNGVEALELVSAYEGPLDLLVTDVMMDKMGGLELSERLGKTRPGLRTIFISGYSEEKVLPAGVSGRTSTFLAKPFRSDELLRAVRAMLDQGSTGASARFSPSST
jgi:PAS domain S-box-containing protein